MTYKAFCGLNYLLLSFSVTILFLCFRLPTELHHFEMFTFWFYFKWLARLCSKENKPETWWLFVDYKRAVKTRSSSDVCGLFSSERNISSTVTVMQPCNDRRVATVAVKCPAPTFKWFSILTQLSAFSNYDTHLSFLVKHPLAANMMPSQTSSSRSVLAAILAHFSQTMASSSLIFLGFPTATAFFKWPIWLGLYFFHLGSCLFFVCVVCLIHFSEQLLQLSLSQSCKYSIYVECC